MCVCNASGQQPDKGEQCSEGGFGASVGDYELLCTPDPDYERDSIIHMPPMLLMAAHMRCNVGADAPVFLPPQTALSDSWRKRERLDCGALVLKLKLLCKVFKQKHCQLSDLYAGLRGTPIGNTTVRVPEDDFVIHYAHDQLGTAEFLQLVVSASTTQRWAWCGPGDKGADSWIIVFTPSYDVVIFIVQSKKLIHAPRLKDRHPQESGTRL